MKAPRDDAMASHIAQLREAFDGAFAAPAGAQEEARCGLLGLRCGQAPFALPVEELAGVHPLGQVIPLPHAPPELLGLCSHRHALLAVWSLRHYLCPDAAPTAPAWIALLRREETLGLAFDQVVGYFDIPTHAVVSGADASPLTPKLAVLEQRYPIIDIPQLIHTIDAP